jgi:hypothetical protein
MPAASFRTIRSMGTRVPMTPHHTRHPLKGAPLGDLLAEVAAIAAFMALGVVLAVATFRKRLG